MTISKFYTIIDAELDEIFEEYRAIDKHIKKHKTLEKNKGYLMLIWFLRFYGQTRFYQSYITDGNGDNSCDIIFSNKNATGEDIFYVVQSKYVKFDSEKKGEDEFPNISTNEFGYALNNFSTVLSGNVTKRENENFNEKYDELRIHLAKNGLVKFLFFTLANSNEGVEDALKTFNQTNSPNVSIEVIDFQRIKKDYIEFKYKEVTSTNPLEFKYDAENTPVVINIERFEDARRDIFEFSGREKAYIVLLKPKTIHELFKKYKFSLFFKNVRNPIHRSNYNQKIVDTLLKRPASFWYFNNGVTAITRLPPNIGIQAEEITVEGFQVINGAQTIYSVYSAYENGTLSERKAMDAYAKIALRLIGSSDEDFNLQITRYTNLQNPMFDRDFFANDKVQQRLQNESFFTDMWYEKRRDEFQLTEEQQTELGIKIVPNEQFIVSYMSFYLQRPDYALSRQNDFFISNSDDKNGLYEQIFNDETRFEDIYAAVFIGSLTRLIYLSSDEDNIGEFLTAVISLSALSKIVMDKYFAITRYKEDKNFDLGKHILNIKKNNRHNDHLELQKIIIYTRNLLNKYTTDIPDKKEMFLSLVGNHRYYNIIAKKIEDTDIDVAEIQVIEIK